MNPKLTLRIVFLLIFATVCFYGFAQSYLEEEDKGVSTVLRKNSFSTDPLSMVLGHYNLTYDRRIGLKHSLGFSVTYTYSPNKINDYVRAIKGELRYSFIFKFKQFPKLIDVNRNKGGGFQLVALNAYQYMVSEVQYSLGMVGRSRRTLLHEKTIQSGLLLGYKGFFSNGRLLLELNFGASSRLIVSSWNEDDVFISSTGFSSFYPYHRYNLRHNFLLIPRIEFKLGYNF